MFCGEHCEISTHSNIVYNKNTIMYWNFISSIGIDAIQKTIGLYYSAGCVCERACLHMHALNLHNILSDSHLSNPFYSCEYWHCGQIIRLSVNSAMEFNLLTSDNTTDSGLEKYTQLKPPIPNSYNMHQQSSALRSDRINQ